LQVKAADQRSPAAQVLSLQQQAGDESAAWEARLAAVQDTLAARDRAATALERELALRPRHEQARSGQPALSVCTRLLLCRPGCTSAESVSRLPAHNVTVVTPEAGPPQMTALQLGPRCDVRACRAGGGTVPLLTLTRLHEVQGKCPAHAGDKNVAPRMALKMVFLTCCRWRSCGTRYGRCRRSPATARPPTTTRMAPSEVESYIHHILDQIKCSSARVLIQNYPNDLKSMALSEGGEPAPGRGSSSLEGLLVDKARRLEHELTMARLQVAEAQGASQMPLSCVLAADGTGVTGNIHRQNPAELSVENRRITL